MLKLGSLFYFAFIGTGVNILQQNEYKTEREAMVIEQIASQGIKDEKVLEAMKKVPRHCFVPEELRHLAYADSPLPIGDGQTISQPYIVAFMTEAAQVNPESRVLEIGTGCGYQSAVLGEICKDVFTIEIVKPLAEKASKLLKELGYSNIHVRQGDGWEGWPEKAPFDIILITAAPEHLPQPILSQLKIGGRIIVPVGSLIDQKLIRYTKTEKGLKEEVLIPVRFVPMTGKAQEN
jgi:protein-L-isoaspartate(D-aspartate) O-methyltransferase